MVSTGLLIGLLLIATVTDLRWRQIYNWNTYPGILAALAFSVIATLLGVDATNGTATQTQILGILALQDSLLGFLSCGAVMLFCYVFFPGGIGGGDVKLIAMMGAFLGLMPGLEAMLWTFVLGACLALMVLIWRYGFLTLLRQCFNYLRFKLRLGGTFQLSVEERRPLKVDLFLSPAALVAVLIVRFQLANWIR